jgi:hypothetical protein
VTRSCATSTGAGTAVHDGELGRVRQLDAAHGGAAHRRAPEVALRAVGVRGGLLQPRAHVRDVGDAHVAGHKPRHLGRRNGRARRLHQVQAARQPPLLAPP